MVDVFGGDAQGIIRDIGVDDDGDVFLVSVTGRTHPQVDAGAWQPMRAGGHDSVVGVMDQDGTAMQWCSYLGGSGDEAGEASVRVDSQQQLVYLSGTFLGGSVGEAIEGIAVAADGSVHEIGATFSDDFPLTDDAAQSQRAGDADAFLAVLSSDLDILVYSTYWGGSDWDYGRATAVDSAGSRYTVGYIASTDFPVTADAAYPNAGGGNDAMLVRLVP